MRAMGLMGPVRSGCAWSVLCVAALVGCGGDDDGAASNSVTKLIGPNGGSVVLAGGAKVDIPEGALSEPTEIKITKLELDDVADLPDNLLAAGKPFAFEPHGTTFAEPVKVQLAYEPEDDDVATTVRPIKAADEDDADWRTIVGSEKDEADKTLTFEVSSFSVMIAARPNRGSGVITLPDGAIVDDAGDSGTGGDGANGGSGGSGGAGGVGGTGGQDAPDAALDATAPDAGDDAGMMTSDLAQDAYIKSHNSETYDGFGAAMAMSGNTLVVSARGESSDGTGNNNNLTGSGAVYVFVYAGGAWSEQAMLKADNPTAAAEFGSDVAIDGDTIVVGARYEDSVASDSGAAYVFTRSGTTWTQDAMLKASNAGSNDEYGASVAISGDTIVVGAPREDSVATGVNNADPGQGDNSWNAAGALYVYVRAGEWSQQAYIKPSEPGILNEFNEASGRELGYDVAIDGDTIVAGAVGDDSNATGIGGVQANNMALNSGAAFVFTRSGGSWSEQAYIKASDTVYGQTFGTSVAIVSDVIAIGMQDTNDYRGGVYTYTRSGSTWSFQQKVRNDDNLSGHNFGAGVAMYGDRMVVGAHGHDGNMGGVNGTPTSCCTMDSGAAYEFVLSGNAWTQVSYIKASRPDYNDWFGYRAVAVSADAIAVGAASEASNATGINGDETNNSAMYSGAVYTFR